MEHITLWVLSDPAERELMLLDALPDETTITVGNFREIFEQAAAPADVICNWTGSRELLESVWRLAPRVRWVHSRSAGLDEVLFPALVQSHVPVTNGSGVFSAPLAEFVMAATLFFAYDLRRMVRNQEAGAWEQFDIQEVAGRTMGILGYGDIGRAIACRARALGMRVIALRRHPEPDALAHEVMGPERQAELLARSDFLAVAAPLTPETRGLIGEAELAVMKAGAVLINVGRGPVVDEAALARALESGRIRGAALDVFEHEPLPAGHPFYRLPNLLLSPHCADHTPDWKARAMRRFLENFEKFRQGEPLEYVVDKTLGY